MQVSGGPPLPKSTEEQQVHTVSAASLQQLFQQISGPPRPNQVLSLQGGHLPLSHMHSSGVPTPRSAAAAETKATLKIATSSLVSEARIRSLQECVELGSGGATIADGAFDLGPDGCVLLRGGNTTLRNIVVTGPSW